MSYNLQQPNYEYDSQLGTLSAKYLAKLTIFDESLEQKYMEQKNLSRIMTLFTLIAIIISLMGVIGIVLFDAQHKRKEIAVRRVAGAGISDILKMLNKKYIITVLVCFIIATPIGIIIIDKYLSGFVNRTPVHLWVFAATLLAVTLITIIIVTAVSFKAATSNPVDHIKDE